jgi:uncharacterized membrane protein YeiH
MTALDYYNLVAIVAFAITGVLAAAPVTQSVVALIVLGVVSAVGGGTIRDLVLGTQVFWIRNFTYIWFAVLGSLAGFLAIEIFRRWKNLLLYLDALGAALFAVEAINKAVGLGDHWGVGVMMGLLTAVGGGVLRDVLVDRPTLLVGRDLYATPIVFGSLVYVALLYVGAGRQISMLIAIALIFGVRSAAIHWNLGVPDWLHVPVTHTMRR